MAITEFSHSRSLSLYSLRCFLSATPSQLGLALIQQSVTLLDLVASQWSMRWGPILAMTR